MGLFSNLFGKKDKPNFKELIKQGAVILDVRTAGEFSKGHINKSKNISVQDLQSQLDKLDKSKIIITCCASGMRSASAASILKKAGYSAYNGGSWESLKNKIS